MRLKLFKIGKNIYGFDSEAMELENKSGGGGEYS